MATEQITIPVDADAAHAYRTASAEEQEKIHVLVSLRIKQVTTADVPLREIMNEISRNARQRGLTPEGLQDLLHE